MTNQDKLKEMLLGVAPTIDQSREAFLVVATRGSEAQAVIQEVFAAQDIEYLPGLLTAGAFDEYQRELQRIMERDSAAK